MFLGGNFYCSTLSLGDSKLAWLYWAIVVSYTRKYTITMSKMQYVFQPYLPKDHYTLFANHVPSRTKMSLLEINRTKAISLSTKIVYVRLWMLAQGELASMCASPRYYLVRCRPLGNWTFLKTRILSLAASIWRPAEFIIASLLGA